MSSNNPKPVIQEVLCDNNSLVKKPQTIDGKKIRVFYLELTSILCKYPARSYSSTIFT